MTFGMVWFLFLGFGTSVSSRIVEEWPVEEKPQPNYFYNIEHLGPSNRDWKGYYSFQHDVKPVKEVETIILTKNVPVSYPANAFLSYNPQRNYPFPVTVQKDATFPVKKIVPVPVPPRPSYSLPPFSYSIKYVKVPVTQPGPHGLRVEENVPIPYPLTPSPPHRDALPYAFPLRLSVPVENPESDPSNKIPDTLFLEKGPPHFNIYLVPFPVDKSAFHKAQPHRTSDSEKAESHMKPGFYTDLKPQGGRNQQLYSVAHKLYNSLSSDKRPPQVVDYNHPIDHDEE